MIQMKRFNQENEYRHEKAVNDWLVEMQSDEKLGFEIISVSVGGGVTVFVYRRLPKMRTTEHLVELEKQE